MIRSTNIYFCFCPRLSFVISSLQVSCRWSKQSFTTDGVGQQHRTDSESEHPFHGSRNCLRTRYCGSTMKRLRCHVLLTSKSTTETRIHDPRLLSGLMQVLLRMRYASKYPDRLYSTPLRDLERLTWFKCFSEDALIVVTVRRIWNPFTRG